MKTYKIPVYWTCFGVMEIEAESLEEAHGKAFLHSTPLPDGDVVSDSFEVAEDMLEEYNPDETNEDSIHNK